MKVLDHLWNAFLFGGTAFVVFGLHQSGWWFALAFLAMLTPRSNDKE